MPSSRRMTPRSSWSSCPRRSLSSALRQTVGDRPPPSPAARETRPARRRARSRGPRPRPHRVAKSSPSRSWRAWSRLAADRSSRRNSASVARRASATAGSSRSRSRSRLARLSRSARPGQLVRQRRRQTAAVPLEPTEQPAHRPAGDLEAEVAGGDVLEVMAFVQNETAVRAAAPPPLPSCPAPAAPTGRPPAGGG